MQKVSDSLAAFLVFASRFTFALTLSAHLFQFSAHTLFPLPAVFVITNGVPKDFIVKVFGVCIPEVMDQFAEQLSDISAVEKAPKVEGRSLTMVLAEKKKK